MKKLGHDLPVVLVSAAIGLLIGNHYTRKYWEKKCDETANLLIEAKVGLESLHDDYKYEVKGSMMQGYWESWITDFMEKYHAWHF